MIDTEIVEERYARVIHSGVRYHVYSNGVILGWDEEGQWRGIGRSDLAHGVYDQMLAAGLLALKDSKTAEVQLREYSQLLGDESGTLIPSVEELIKSHYDLRELNKAHHREYCKMYDEHIQAAIERTENDLRNDGWMSKERLSKMTLAEIAAWVGSGE